jgi:hypothetical protein
MDEPSMGHGYKLFKDAVQAILTLETPSLGAKPASEDNSHDQLPAPPSPALGALLEDSYATASAAYAHAAVPGAAQQALHSAMRVDVNGRVLNSAYATVVKCEARWFLLPHEAADALVRGVGLIVI